MTNRTHDQDDAEQALPRDLDDFLNTLKRRLADAQPRGWMRCASPRCRRERRCADENFSCCTAAPGAPMTQDERAEMNATLIRALNEQMRRG